MRNHINQKIIFSETSVTATFIRNWWQYDATKCWTIDELIISESLSPRFLADRCFNRWLCKKVTYENWEIVTTWLGQLLQLLEAFWRSSTNILHAKWFIMALQTIAIISVVSIKLSGYTKVSRDRYYVDENQEIIATQLDEHWRFSRDCWIWLKAISWKPNFVPSHRFPTEDNAQV